jgi:hypothetical protein
MCLSATREDDSRTRARREVEVSSLKRYISVAALLILITVFAFVLQGYHPGAEDDGVYLSAIKKDLNPSLYPYNAEFFTLQMQATVFDKAVAATVRWTHLPLSYVCLGWQLAAIGLLLAGCRRLVGFCYPGLCARLAGVLTVSCLFTLSVAGVGLYIVDEHLHPRTLATDALVFAIDALQRGQRVRAALLLLVSFLFHPLMAVFGLSFCILSMLLQRWPRAGSKILAGAAAIYAPWPGSWIFAPSTPAWRQALLQHSYYTLTRWTWYEWLGAIAPPLLLFLLARFARRHGNTPLFRLASTLSLFSTVQLAIAMLILLPPGLQRLTPLQPMRYLHLTYLLMFLLAGATLGECWLRGHPGRWLLVFLPLAAANGYAQRLRYPGTRNLELPWTAPHGPWLQAFRWVRTNTPEDAVFALDPGYLALPDEDNHSFRALAERSSLADDQKDAAVVSQVPALAESWLAQHRAQAGWPNWTRADFVRLARTTPVRWVLVTPAQAKGLDCPYANEAVEVCRIP